MLEEVLIAGFGGQGVLSMGQLIAQAAMEQGMNASWIPSYGPEMRGGTANCIVCVSDDEIGAPLAALYDAVVVMNQPSLEKFESKVKTNGTLLVNSSIIPIKTTRNDLEACYIEANDIAAVSALGGRPHVVGPFVNAYNEGTLDYLFRRGALRVALPAELSAEAIAALAAHAGGERLEVQVFGRLPLALSARCYHARVHGLHKDGCRYVCGEDPDGLDLETLDGEPFLAVNGTQTMTYTVCNLIGALGELSDLGIGGFRLWPQAVDMVAVAETFRAVLDGREDPEAAVPRLEEIAGIAPFAAGFYEGREDAARELPFSLRAE